MYLNILLFDGKIRLKYHFYQNSSDTQSDSNLEEEIDLWADTLQ